MNEMALDGFDRVLVRLAGACVLLALLAGLAAIGLHRETQARSQGRPAVIVVPPANPSVVDSAAADRVPVDLQRFALNALLAPLLDDDEPPRWTDVAIAHFCDPQTRVFIDGEPLIPGSPVPRQAFSVRWDMNHCEPMGPAMALSGRVELVVTNGLSAMHAVVRPATLQVHSDRGLSVLRDPFTARLDLIAVSTAY